MKKKLILFVDVLLMIVLIVSSVTPTRVYGVIASSVSSPEYFKIHFYPVDNLGLDIGGYYTISSDDNCKNFTISFQFNTNSFVSQFNSTLPITTTSLVVTSTEILSRTGGELVIPLTDNAVSGILWDKSNNREYGMQVKYINLHLKIPSDTSTTNLCDLLRTLKDDSYIEAYFKVYVIPYDITKTSNLLGQYPLDKVGIFVYYRSKNNTACASVDSFSVFGLDNKYLRNDPNLGFYLYPYSAVFAGPFGGSDNIFPVSPMFRPSDGRARIIIPSLDSTTSYRYIDIPARSCGESHLVKDFSAYVEVPLFYADYVQKLVADVLSGSITVKSVFSTGSLHHLDDGNYLYTMSFNADTPTNAIYVVGVLPSPIYNNPFDLESRDEVLNNVATYLYWNSMWKEGNTTVDVLTATDPIQIQTSSMAEMVYRSGLLQDDLKNLWAKIDPQLLVFLTYFTDKLFAGVDSPITTGYLPLAPNMAFYKKWAVDYIAGKLKIFNTINVIPGVILVIERKQGTYINNGGITRNTFLKSKGSYTLGDLKSMGLDIYNVNGQTYVALPDRLVKLGTQTIVSQSRFSLTQLGFDLYAVKSATISRYVATSTPYFTYGVEIGVYNDVLTASLIKDTYIDVYDEDGNLYGTLTAAHTTLQLEKDKKYFMRVCGSLGCYAKVSTDMEIVPSTSEGEEEVVELALRKGINLVGVPFDITYNWQDFLQKSGLPLNMQNMIYIFDYRNGRFMSVNKKTEKPMPGKGYLVYSLLSKTVVLRMQGEKSHITKYVEKSGERKGIFLVSPVGNNLKAGDIYVADSKGRVYRNESGLDFIIFDYRKGRFLSMNPKEPLFEGKGYLIFSLKKISVIGWGK